MFNDPLDEESRRLLCVPPAQRDAALLDATIQLTNKHAPDFFSTITAAQHMALAKAWRYQFFPPGADICMPEEECASFYIVLEGACVCTERQVHHLEGRAGSEGFRRIVNCRRGKAFGHYPLVIGESKYDYSARVEDAPGCCLLLVPKAAYMQVMRKEIERQMKDTVGVLHQNKTFAPWSLHALNRLYFWFTRRRYGSSDDIVRQGVRMRARCPLPCRCHAAAMPLPCRCRAAAMPLPSVLAVAALTPTCPTPSACLCRSLLPRVLPGLRTPPTFAL